jgi:hypothetical protein
MRRTTLAVPKPLLHILGVRHHGPGSARSVARALDQLRPDLVLIEGPVDANEVIPFAVHPSMQPPVAIVVYDPDEPSDSAFYPFAAFSPEWVAMRWALAAKSQVRFMDLPFQNRKRTEKSAEKEHESSESEADSDADLDEESGVASARPDPLNALALAAGFEDGEAWWGRLIEENSGNESTLAVFDVIREAMAQVRESDAKGSDKSRKRDGERREHEDAREAHMRRAIRAGIKEGASTIAVVCGAWHAPVLTVAALEEFSVKADDAILKAVPKRKLVATWIPWTSERLAMESGYGAGVVSPGWYQHVWTHGHAVPPVTVPDASRGSGRLVEAWLTRVARFMRAEDLDAPPASVIEAARLSVALAAMRGRTMPGLDELNESILSILCHGNPMPMEVIRRKLIVGVELGEVPEEAPSVPLQRDLAAQQKSLRLKQSADDVILELDQRKESDLAKSVLLHRLSLLKINWGERTDDLRRSLGTFRETWKLQWKPELSVAVVEAARWGNTVVEAAKAFVSDRCRRSKSLPELASLLQSLLPADLPGAMEACVARLESVGAVSGDVGHLMDAIPAMAALIRYGDVRRTETAIVEPVLRGFVGRVCAGLSPACASLDDDAAEAMREKIEAVNAALWTLENTEFLELWWDQLQRLGDADVHGLVVARCWRLLLDASRIGSEQAAARLGYALSPGNSYTTIRC